MFMNIILSSVTDKSNRRRWAFLNTLQALDPPTFKSFGLTFLRKRFWESIIRSKTARYRLFLTVVRCDF
eukprot:UN21880